MSVQSPSQTPAILASHLSHFLSLPQFSSSHFLPLTSQVRGELLLSNGRIGRCADIKEMQEFKVTVI